MSLDRDRVTAPGRSVLAASLETFALRLLVVAVAFFSTVLVSRLLGPEGRGLYYVPLVAAGVLIAVAKLGLEQANVYLYATRGVALKRLAAQNAVVALLIGAIASVVLVAAPPLLPAVFADVPWVLVLVAALTIPFSVHTQFTAGLQNVSGQVTWQFTAALLAGIVQLAVLGVLAVVDAISVGSVMLATLAGAVLAWALTLMRSGMTYLLPRWDVALLRESLSQSLVLHVGMLLFFLHLRVDMFMLKGMSGAYAVGQYSLAVVLAETVLIAPDSISIALLPRQMSTSVRDAAVVALRAVRLSAVLGLLIAAGWVALGPTLIRIVFGPDFLPAFEPLAVLLPGMIFLGMQRACGPPVLRLGRPERIGLIYGITLALNVLLNMALIPSLGATGAAVASTLSYSLGSVLFIVWLTRIANVPLRIALRPTREDYERLRELGLGALEALRTAMRSGPQPK